MKSSDEWCDSVGEKVYTDKKTRCSLCGRRLSPRESESGLFYTLPPHKKKGYKIKRIKDTRHITLKAKKHTAPKANFRR